MQELYLKINNLRPNKFYVQRTLVLVSCIHNSKIISKYTIKIICMIQYIILIFMKDKIDE